MKNYDADLLHCEYSDQKTLNLLTIIQSLEELTDYMNDNCKSGDHPMHPTSGLVGLYKWQQN